MIGGLLQGLGVAAESEAGVIRNEPTFIQLTLLSAPPFISIYPHEPQKHWQLQEKLDLTPAKKVLVRKALCHPMLAYFGVFKAIG